MLKTSVYSADPHPTFTIDEEKGTLRNRRNLDYEKLGDLVVLTIEARDEADSDDVFHVTTCKVCCTSRLK